MEVMQLNFTAWKGKCVKSLHMKKAKEILSFLVRGGSVSANFYVMPVSFADMPQPNLTKPRGAHY